VAVFTPLMLIIAAAIKLTGRGAVLYRQTRTSLAGEAFGMLKFRTMVPGAEDQTGAVMAGRDDPRVTRVGRLLRRTSLDELPQLFNVLAGQMSLVGPRPERPELIEQFARDVPRYLLRQQVKAGITGLAQVHGMRGRTSIRRRIRYDVFYINNWTFGLDLRILLLTLLKGFINPNAY
jgi:lipopolysaccharide/colanic/teichoic acid biosynthesis glycosyltransferase